MRKVDISIMPIAICIILCLIAPSIAIAHCDTLDGPVVKDAKSALEKGDVTAVLKWVKKEHESEVIGVFNNTLVERKKSPEAKEVAEKRFFETLVRIHRAGEGVPFMGLKPAGSVEPAIAAADNSLESGSVSGLKKEITALVDTGIEERFSRVLEAKKHKDENVEAGREFVEAYVEFVHYVERLHLDALGKVGHEDTNEEEDHHRH